MARLFNGSTQSMSTGATLTLGSAATIAFWLWWDSYASTDTFAFELSSNYTTGNYFRLSPADTVTGAWGVGMRHTAVTNYTYGGFTRPSAAAWHHIVITMLRASPSVLAAYVDGVNQTVTYAIGPQNDSSSFDVTQLYSMARNNFSNWAAGRLAEIGIWAGVALTAAEAAILGAGYAPPLVRPGSLYRYWPLLTQQSPEIELVAGSTFSLTGAPTATPHPAVIYPASLDVEIAATAAAAGAGSSKAAAMGRHRFSGDRACGIGRHVFAA